MLETIAILGLIWGGLVIAYNAIVFCIAIALMPFAAIYKITRVLSK